MNSVFKFNKNFFSTLNSRLNLLNFKINSGLFNLIFKTLNKIDRNKIFILIF